MFIRLSSADCNATLLIRDAVCSISIDFYHIGFAHVPSNIFSCNLINNE